MDLLISVLALVVCGLAGLTCASDSIAWCYHDPSCGPDAWPTIVSPQFCCGSRQSPINIVTDAATEDSSLTSFSFSNFHDNSALTKISNTGHAVKVALENVAVSGGGLSGGYQALQFHLHWGNGAAVPGSEHTVDGRRYPMEMHIVTMKESHHGDLEQALKDPQGLAALGFFIEVDDDSLPAAPGCWSTLATYLKRITNEGVSADITAKISLDDLLVGVDLTRYYRYMGSLTTPACDEAVVWTVFKDTIKVSKDVIDLFSTTVRIGGASSLLMTDTYRNIQPDQRVYSTVDARLRQGRPAPPETAVASTLA
ncbi:hypothetical protein NHX12_011153 [Muraenolepis orangiensis]|uniref:Carbonic anhydrase n=1 Tax=Muraenolepis orangiensis TaxID=630683 RepID=A0A9Q0DFS7_9TELE|nr:hypothetical protein NHX12_011153 [Muraenolepis orangiensis]